MQIYCVTWPEEPFNLLLKQQPPVVAGNTAIFTQPVESFRDVAEGQDRVATDCNDVFFILFITLCLYLSH